MAKIKSARKRAKTSEERQTRNRAVKSVVLTTRNKLYAAIGGGNKAEAEQLLRSYSSALDRGVKKGTIKANTANRRKSRAALRMKKAFSAAG